MTRCASDNPGVRTHAEVATIRIEHGRARSVVLVGGEEIEAQEVMGPVLDADCRAQDIPNLRVADASVMPTLFAGKTYLGCVMVAERIASKMTGQRGQRDQS